MLDAKKLEEMSQMDLSTLARSKLVEIATVQIDPLEPIQTRIISYINQIKNPYCFMVGKTPVKIRFTESGQSLDEALKGYFISLKKS